MKMFSWFLVVSLTLVMSTGLMAQDDEEEFEKDFIEAAMYGGGAMPMGTLPDWNVTSETGTEEMGARNGYSVGVDVGHFLTTNLVLGLNVTYAHFKINSDNAVVAPLRHQLVGPAAYLKYYFSGESNFMPYIKGQVGVDIAKFTTRVLDENQGGYVYRELAYHPALSFGIGGGLFYYTHDYGGLYVEVSYRTAFSTESVSDYGGVEYTFGQNADMLDVHAGIKVFFGSDE